MTLFKFLRRNMQIFWDILPGRMNVDAISFSAPLTQDISVGKLHNDYKQIFRNRYFACSNHPYLIFEAVKRWQVCWHICAIYEKTFDVLVSANYNNGLMKLLIWSA